MERIELEAKTEIPKNFYLVHAEETTDRTQPCEFSFRVSVGYEGMWGIYISDMTKFLIENGDCIIRLHYGIPMIVVRGTEE